MNRFYKFMILVLCILTVCFGISCKEATDASADQTGADPQSEASGAATEDATKAKPTEKPTDYLSKIEDTTGLDLNVKILSQNLHCANGDGGTVEQRKSRFAALVAEYQPDIIGTQEATHDWMTYLKTLDGYRAVGVSRDGRWETSGEWSAILYKFERFVMLDSGTFWLTDTPDEVGAVEGSLCRRICTWAEFFDRYTGENIIMANTHLDHSNNDVRERQAECLTEHLGELIGDRIDLTIYLTGDFNFTNESSAYAKVVDAGFADSRVIVTEDVAPMKGTFHSYRDGETNSEIDFCFVMNAGEALEYDIITKKYASEGESEVGFVSDHYGVLVTFLPMSLT